MTVPTDREPVIRLRGIRNQFGSHVVHDGLDLDVYRGEILGVVGGSGTGKSVLLRSIAGLQRPARLPGQPFLFVRRRRAACAACCGAGTRGKRRSGPNRERRSRMKLLFIIDPLAELKIYKDSS